MILTEDKNYTMSLEVEDRESATGLIGKNIEMEFSARELLHAVITCGIPVQRMTTAYFSKKKLELIYKLFLVETALDTEGDRLKKARSIAYLDSSEKSVMSYYMGMFLTKLISRRLYGVDYLTHLNLIQSMDGNGFIDFFNSEWRQDMIGFQPDKKSWSVWEAKGGSNRREQALKKGCQQAAAIESVNGLAPDPGAVCMTYYDHSFLCGVIRQPENSQAKNRERVCFTEEAFLGRTINQSARCLWNREPDCIFMVRMQRFLFLFPVFQRRNRKKRNGGSMWECPRSCFSVLWKMITAGWRLKEKL